MHAKPLPTRGVGWATLPIILLLALPLAVFFWLLGNPRQNVELLVPFDHFVIVANVSVVALAVSLLLAHGAIRIGQPRLLLLALGFMSMAGLFTVHAIATPGVIVKGLLEDYGGTVIGLSALLSLFVPALFFAAHYSRVGDDLERWIRSCAGAVVIGVAGVLVAYGALGVYRTALLGSIPLSSPPASYVLAAVTTLLLAFAAWRQTGVYLASRRPVQGALVAAYILLAEAQVSMIFGPTWTLAWWEYHGLMLAAVVLAMGALFIELDRRQDLERFLPATIVDRVLEGGKGLTGERRVLTVLFADLRDTTALAEQLPTDAVVDFLNVSLGVLAGCVFAHGGVLDKFLGDGLMATFEGAGDGAVDAARAGLAMRRGMLALNEERVARGRDPARYGVGINTGEVVLGLVGLPQRSDYTVIGNTVNTAARLQGVCKQLGVDLVLTSDTAERLQGHEFQPRPLGTATVAGKAHPLSVFTLE